jgi:hypothetical protein
VANQAAFRHVFGGVTDAGTEPMVKPPRPSIGGAA